MRIVAGTWRGRPIRAPKGTSTRPTTDRVREAMFSMLESLLGSLDGISVLDAYAGSGALGLEALSRGASRATFVEQDPRARTALEDNVKVFDAFTVTTILPGNISQMSQRGLRGAPFSLLLLDPPYRINKAEVRGVIENLITAGSVSEGAVIVWEHATGETPDWPPFVRPHADRRYGSTELGVGIVRLGEEDR